ncbi:MAG: hypothetical protein MEEGG_02691 [Eggerthella lenta]
MPGAARAGRLRRPRHRRERHRFDRGLRHRGGGRRYRRAHGQPQGSRRGRESHLHREDDEGPRLLRVLRRRGGEVPGGHRDRQGGAVGRDVPQRVLARAPRTHTHLRRPFGRGYRFLAGRTRQGTERLRHLEGGAGSLHLRHAGADPAHRHGAGLLRQPLAAARRRSALRLFGHLRVPRDARGGEGLRQPRPALQHAGRAAGARRFGTRGRRHRQERRRVRADQRRKRRDPGHGRLRCEP